ncbi:hypothetical protein TGCAST_367170 [Toxoplasma gondii CAST]|uniref:Uncharacterized protein n=1 Tax=Toxoplasma gondii CAST TaxID=943122 RepID=A0A3R8AYH6_TOXGO|nr:hypothetical protein TGCAST_367170 [Toxoplasma gondii CAST]
MTSTTKRGSDEQRHSRYGLDSAAKLINTARWKVKPGDEWRHRKAYRKCTHWVREGGETKKNKSTDTCVYTSTSFLVERKATEQCAAKRKSEIYRASLSAASCPLSRSTSSAACLRILSSDKNGKRADALISGLYRMELIKEIQIQKRADSSPYTQLRDTFTHIHIHIPTYTHRCIYRSRIRLLKVCEV